MTTAEALRRAQALMRANRLKEAADTYARALQRDVHAPEAWYNLGWLRRRLGEADAALTAYDKALAQGVDKPEEVRLNRAVILSDMLMRHDAARAELNAALTLSPDYLPALMNLANLEEGFGRRGEAASLYERVLALEPNHGEALARLANCSIVQRGDPMRTRLTAVLARSDLEPAQRASLGFALGRLLDAEEAYDEAFSAYRAANAASRLAAGPGFRGYDRRAQEAFVTRVMEAFPEPAPAAGRDGAAPIFICGMFRSGSTLIEQVLAGHARVTGGGEIPFIPTLAARELAPFPEKTRALDDAAYAMLAQRYLETTRAMFPDADLLTDKRPDNFLYVGLIKRMFPHAKIVHTLRNPLDNCLSVYFLHLAQSMAYALKLTDAGHFCVQERRLMAHWRALYPETFYEFDYDAFVRDPHGALNPLLNFCGLDWDAECLNLSARRGIVATASAWQVREPLYQRSSGRWRHYASYLNDLRAQLAPLGDVVDQ